MKKYLIFIAAACLAFACVSCQKKELVSSVQATQEVVFDISQRPMVDFSASASLGGDASKLTFMHTDGMGMKLSWESEEKLSVFIVNADGTAVRYAGEVGSTGLDGDVMNFHGSVAETITGEEYLLVWPSTLNSSSDSRTGDATLPDGASVCSKITWTGQSGALSSIDHINSGKLVPIVWRKNAGDGKYDASHQAYIMRLCLQFNEDPGTITSVKVRTMNQASADKVFPVAFNAANLFKAQNNTLASAKTPGTSLGADYASELVFTVSGGGSAVKNDGTGLWEAEAFVAVGSVKNLEVFNSKYRIDVSCSGKAKPYQSAFISFPHQGDSGAQSAKSLDMSDAFADGKTYKMVRQLSPCHVPVVINSDYKVNSLVGMWNEYGKLYDVDGVITEDFSNLPAALNDLLGSTDKQTSFTGRYTSKLHGGSPSFTYDLYESQCVSASDHTQRNVSVNNIEITAPTKVFVTFVDEYAWSQNLLGYYHYPTAQAPAGQLDVEKDFIFPNVSKPSHEPFAKGETGHLENNNIAPASAAPLQRYQTVQLIYRDGAFCSETFPAGTTIGFLMIRDPAASTLTYDNSTDGNIQSYTPRGDQGSILDWNAWKFFTNTLWNQDNSGYGSPVRYNNFASGDICNLASAGAKYSESSGKIKGLAIYGGRDDINNNTLHAYSAMLFMVSTSDPEAMKTFNKAALNVGAGDLVAHKTGRMISYELGEGVVSSSNITSVADGDDYSTTLSAAHALLGPLVDVTVKVGAEDKTSEVYNSSTGVVAIPSSLGGDVVISAKTGKIAKAKSLTFEEAGALSSGDKVVLYAANSSNAEAFGYKGGAFIKLPSAKFPLNNGNAMTERDVTSTFVDVADYRWSVSAASDPACFRFSNAEGKWLIKSSTPYYGGAPKVAVEDLAEPQTATTYVLVDAGAGLVYIKENSGDTTYKYMTSRFGASNSTPIFYDAMGHVNSYGKWRVYKLWFE